MCLRNFAVAVSLSVYTYIVHVCVWCVVCARMCINNYFDNAQKKFIRKAVTVKATNYLCILIRPSNTTK